MFGTRFPPHTSGKKDSGGQNELLLSLPRQMSKSGKTLMLWGGMFYCIATMSLSAFLFAIFGITVLDTGPEQAPPCLAVFLQWSCVFLSHMRNPSSVEKGAMSGYKSFSPMHGCPHPLRPACGVCFVAVNRSRNMIHRERDSLPHSLGLLWCQLDFIQNSTL